jgi:type IV secretion system protein VirB6
MLKRLKYIMMVMATIVSLVNPSYVFGNFGTSCATPLVSGDNGYLQNNTIYGYLQQMIDSKTYVPSGSCTDKLQQLTICISNPTRSNPPCDLVTLFPNTTTLLTQISTNPVFANDVSLSTVQLSVSIIGSDICLTMPTPYGNQSLVCKALGNIEEITPPVDQDTCSPAAQACIGINYSQSIFNFSGGAVECVVQTLNNIFFDNTQCPANETSYLISLKAFSAFQAALQNAVKALLIIYVIGYGLNILLEGGKVSLDSIVGFVMKFLLVAYFSVGLGPVYFTDTGKATTHNGMVEWGLPILTQATTDFAEMMFAAGGKRSLCSFDVDAYPNGGGGYALWDVIDCKLGAYFGIKSVYNLGDVIGSNHLTEVGVINPPMATRPLSSTIDADDSASGELAIFCVLFLLMIGGGFLIVIALFYFLLIFFGFVFGFISIFTVCMITLHALVYIAPIFVPMALFERTKGYFDAWTKALIGCALQPMVIAGFTAIIITMYDGLLYGGCEFVIHQYESIYSMPYRAFEMVIPVDNAAKCVASPAYMLLAYILGAGAAQDNYIFFTIDYINDIYNLVGQALILMVLSNIFYYFSLSLYRFAADLTGGIDTSGVAISAAKIVNKVKEAVKFAILVVRAVLRDPTAKKELEDKAKQELKEAAPKGGDDKSSGGGAPRAGVPGEGASPKGGMPPGIGK